MANTVTRFQTAPRTRGTGKLGWVRYFPGGRKPFMAMENQESEKTDDIDDSIEEPADIPNRKPINKVIMPV